MSVVVSSLRIRCPIHCLIHCPIHCLFTALSVSMTGVASVGILSCFRPIICFCNEPRVLAYVLTHTQLLPNYRQRALHSSATEAAKDRASHPSAFSGGCQTLSSMTWGLNSRSRQSSSSSSLSILGPSIVIDVGKDHHGILCGTFMQFFGFSMCFMVFYGSPQAVCLGTTTVHYQVLANTVPSWVPPILDQLFSFLQRQDE
jgi:hypothetical protein